MQHFQSEKITTAEQWKNLTNHVVSDNHETTHRAQLRYIPDDSNTKPNSFLMVDDNGIISTNGNQNDNRSMYKIYIQQGINFSVLYALFDGFHKRSAFFCQLPSNTPLYARVSLLTFQDFPALFQEAARTTFKVVVSVKIMQIM